MFSKTPEAWMIKNVFSFFVYFSGTDF